MTLHDAGRIGHPKATWGITEGNPIHDDVREIAGMVGVHFAVDVTLNRDQQITAVFAGDLFAEHRQACDCAGRRHARGPLAVRRRAHHELRISAGQNLYQAVKGMSAAAKWSSRAERSLRGECRDGIPMHGSYGEVLASADSAALLAMINAPGYAVPDQWQVQIQAQILTKAVVMVKAAGSPDELRAAHLQPIDDVSIAVREALRTAGPAATLCVLPQGPQTIPYVRSS